MNQRIIKFRAWDKANKKWWNGGKSFSFYDMAEWEDWPRGIRIEDFEFIQFTGLHDKNGKEIYESDYLGDYCVFWGIGKYILQNISTGDILDCNENTTYNKEVTGNRYENPREHKVMASDL